MRHLARFRCALSGQLWLRGAPRSCGGPLERLRQATELSHVTRDFNAIPARASIVVLLLLDTFNHPALDLISSEAIAEEIVRTLTSGIGLILAAPISSAIAAAVASRSRPRGHQTAPRNPLGVLLRPDLI